MAHLPLCSHPNPKSVCIIGGGDGGVLRQVCRHKCVTKIILVEIDTMVINVAKKYFSRVIGKAFEDPRLTIVQDDAANFIAARQSEFDVIISDNGDPIGPAQSLFEPEFYEKMYNALTVGGIVCVQAESFWIHLDLISDLLACTNEIFEHAEYASTMVPTYPCGQIGFVLAGKRTKTGTCRAPRRILPADLGQELQWYNPQTHKAAFVLPNFVQQRLDQDADDDDDKDRVDKCFLDNCTIS
jgi:spermidine synthase